MNWSDYTGDPMLPPPDVYLGVPFDVYMRWPYLSKSGISDFLISPAQHLARMLGQLDKATPIHYLIGSLTDLMWVEQQDPADHGYHVMPEGMSRRGKRYDLWLASVGDDATAVPHDIMAKAQAMVAALNANAKACSLREGSQPQVSVVWDCPQSGLRRKGRPDLVDFERKIVSDLKTARDVRPRELSRAVSDYLYHWQLQGYIEALQTLQYGDDWRAWIVAVRNEPVHSVACHPIAIAALELARAEQLPVLMRYRECALAGTWPADDDSEEILDVPTWRYRVLGQAAGIDD